MENFDQPHEGGIAPSKDETLAITQEVRQFWRQTSAWALFFAILLFMLFGLVSLSGLFTAFSGGIFGLISGIFIVILYGVMLFFPGLFYYRFATQMKQALILDDIDLLDRAFNNLKLYYRYVGIMMITIITLYLMFFLLFGAALLRSGGFPTE
jgi:hypothetical protein